MTRMLIPALSLLVQLHAMPALAAAPVPELPANTPERTMTQNARVELSAPPAEQPPPAAPALRHFSRTGR